MSMVDVCIPIHQPNPEYLDSLLSSLARQSLRDFVVWAAIDDAPAHLEEIFESYKNTMNVQAHRNYESWGMVQNWNRAVELGSSPMAILVGQDDVLQPDALEELSSALMSESGAVLASSGRTFIDEYGLPLYPKLRLNDRSRIFVERDRYTLNQAELTYLCLRNGNAFGEPPAVLFSRRAFEAVDGYSSHLRHAVDVDFNLRMVALGSAVYVKKALLTRRRHSGAQTQLNIRDGTTSSERLHLLEAYSSSQLLTYEQLGRCKAAVASHSLFDLLRGIKAGNSAVVRTNAKILLALRTVSLRHLALRFKELITGRNMDRR